MPKKTKTQEKKPKPGYIICPDCGAEYMTGKPHAMFCPAHTCEECGTSFREVIEPDEDGRRLCEGCKNPEEDDED